MAQGKHDELRRTFDLVISASPEQREALLDRECRGDAALRSRVAAMIAAAEDERIVSDRASNDLPTQAFDPRSGGAPSRIAPPRPFDHAKPLEAPGEWIGPYKLLQVIGEGGFGTVFMAEQEKPVARKVALKIIKLGMDTRQVVARFEQERQALAIMDHPNIAKVFDAGATEAGRPYFVMELCKGDPIAEYCDKHSLNVRERLDLFAQVCTAVQHAHTKGIIHRDIKPSNILVTTQDGRPSAKVIDFGIAKATNARLTEKTLFTEHKQLIGTPEYMSPEQAEGSLDIDTRTDVYSLGVLLYELLTGGTPFSSKQLRSGAFGEIQRIIREVDPPRPSTRISESRETNASVAARRQTEPRKLSGLVRGELDWIVMKALEKDRFRRYESANGLAADVRRFLAGELVLAAPPSASYRFRKFVKRNKGPVSAAAAVAVALLLGVVAFAWQAKAARDQRDLAIAARQAEAEQRKVADEQRDRALAAEGETRQRAEELKKVSDFQSNMLSQINAADAGSKLIDDLRARFAAALEKSGTPEAERDQRAATFGAELRQINATDAAAELIDRTILKPALTAVESQFKDQPLVDASLRNTLSELYRTLGNNDEAFRLQEQALSTRRRVLGNDHPDTLMSINSMGSIVEAQGKLVEAEAAYREALEARRRVLGDDHRDTLISSGNLGNYLRSQGKLDEAEPLLRASIDGCKRALGAEDRNTLIAMNTYGYLLIDQGKFAEAEPYWREAFETGKRVFGPDDPDVIVWINNMGGLLGVLGREREAEPYKREALEATRRVRGEDHPDTIRCIDIVGHSIAAQGRYAEAEIFAREAVAASRRVLGDEHPNTLACMSSLGSLLQRQGKLEEAEAFLRDSLATRRRLLGNDHPSTLDGIGTLAQTLTSRAKWDEAEALFREALDTAERMHGNDHPTTFVILNNLGNMLVQQDRLTEAEPILRRALEGRRRVSGEEHPQTLIVMSNLGRVLEKQNKLEEAEVLYREALEKFRKVQGNDHPNTISAVGNVGTALREQKRWADALPFCVEAASGSERVLGKDHAQTGYAKLSLGRVLTHLDRFAEAEPQLIDADRILAVAQGVPAARREQCIEALVALYEKWEIAEPGRGHDAKAAEWKAKFTKDDKTP